MEAGAVSGLSRIVYSILIFLSVAFCSRAEEVSAIFTPVPVFNVVGPNGQMSGYSVDLVRGILHEAGLEGKLRTEPFARMLVDLQANPQQLGASMVRTPERESLYYWITSVTEVSNYLYVRADSPFAQNEITEISDISNIAVKRDDYRQEQLFDAGVDNVVSVNTWEQAIELLLLGRVDALYFSSIGVRLVCEEAHLDCSGLVPAFPGGTPVSYIVLPNVAENAGLAEMLIAAAARFKASEGFATLTEQVAVELARSGLGVATIDGALNVTDDSSLTKSEHLWVLGELAGDFAKLNSNREMVGYNADLVRAILIEVGIDAPIQSVPWQRLLRETLQKPNVLSFAVARTPERENQFHWVTPITRNAYGFFGHGELKLSGMFDIPAGTVIGTLKQDFRSQVATAANLITLEYDSWGGAVKALYNGDIDLVFASQWVIGLGCRELKRACDDISMDVPYKEVTTWLVLSKPKTSAVVVEKLKEAAVKAKKTANYQQWAERWVADINQRNNTEFSFRDGIMHLYTTDQTQ